METNISSYFGNGKWNFRKTHLASLILDTKTSFSLRSRCYLFLIRRLASNYPINKMLRNVFKSSTLLSFHISSVVHRGSILVSAPLKCNASIIGHPLGGGDPGQIQRWMGTYTGIWTINLPWRRGKWGRFVFQKPCTAGKTGDFANETGQFQVVLNEETWRPLCRRTWSTFLLVFVMATSADGAGIVM